jgi:transcriptional regulator of arginine metabolism
MKAQRQAAILELVRREQIASQETLRQRLVERGFTVTQATLSRDIKEIGLVKRAAGGYQAPGQDTRPASAEATLRRTAREFLRSWEVVQNLIVLRTDPGRAQNLAVDIDRAGLPEIAGTIGGDDTILVITRDPGQAQAIAGRFAAWVSPRTQVEKPPETQAETQAEEQAEKRAVNG